MDDKNLDQNRKGSNHFKARTLNGKKILNLVRGEVWGGDSRLDGDQKREELNLIANFRFQRNEYLKKQGKTVEHIT